MVNKRERLLSIPQFSDALNLTVSGARRWVLERRVAHVKVGRLVRIPESELNRIVANGFRPARQPERNGR